MKPGNNGGDLLLFKRRAGRDRAAITPSYSNDPPLQKEGVSQRADSCLIITEKGGEPEEDPELMARRNRPASTGSAGKRQRKGSPVASHRGE